MVHEPNSKKATPMFEVENNVTVINAFRSCTCLQHVYVYSMPFYFEH